MRYLFFLLVMHLSLPVLAHIDDEARQAYATLNITDEAVELIATYPARYAFPVMLDGLSPIEMDKLEPEDMAAKIGPMLAEFNPVRIDGVLVRPKIEMTVTEMIQSRLPPRAFILPQVMQYGELRYVAVYETKSPPRRVSIEWDTFVPEYGEDGGPTEDGEIAPVPVVVRFDEKQQLAVLTVDEPEHVWHSEQSAAVPASLAVSALAQPTVYKVPLLSLGVLLIGLVLAALVKQRPARVAFVIGGLVLGASAWGIDAGSYTIEVEPVAEQPSEAEAIELFRSLHANIYRAFDYTDEGAVYDALAQSVDGPMLELIYNDVYQSLIMREEGGAVCRVQKVEVEDAALLDPAEVQDPEALDPGAYRVRAAWRVDGLVQHHGHTHTRINSFEAEYTIAPRQAGWRIVDVEILDQQRIDDGQQGL